MAIKLKMIFLISALFLASGCTLAETRSQNQAIQAENRQVYQIYQKYMQSLNEEREMSGLPPRPIRSYEDWQKSPRTD
jgi:outer membrane biogenesis lipoprotein LolB